MVVVAVQLALVTPRLRQKRWCDWRCRGSNPGPLACKASALPLSHTPQRRTYKHFTMPLDTTTVNNLTEKPQNVRQPGFEPESHAWEACMIPLHHRRNELLQQQQQQQQPQPLTPQNPNTPSMGHKADECEQCVKVNTSCA